MTHQSVCSNVLINLDASQMFEINKSMDVDLSLPNVIHILPVYWRENVHTKFESVVCEWERI